MTSSHSSVRPLPRRRLVTLAAAASLIGAASAAAIPPGGAVSRPQGATVTIGNPKAKTVTVKQGGKILVTGTNWKAQGSRTCKNKVKIKCQVVTIKLDDLHIVAVLPIRNKQFRGLVTIPRRAATGRHTLRFLAAQPATSIKSRPFTVTKG